MWEINILSLPSNIVPDFTIWGPKGEMLPDV